MTGRCDRPRCRQPAEWVVYLSVVCDRHLANEIREQFGQQVRLKANRMSVSTLRMMGDGGE